MKIFFLIFFLIFAIIPHRLVDFLLFRASERRWESNDFVSLPRPTFHRRNFPLRSFRFFGFSQKSPTFERFFEDILDFFGGKFCIEHDDIEHDDVLWGFENATDWSPGREIKPCVL